MRSAAFVRGLALSVIFGVAGLVPPLVHAADDTSPTGVLTQYLNAIKQGDYPRAYALLPLDEQRYFRSPSNYASVFTVDRFQLDAYQVRSSHVMQQRAEYLVDEHFRFLDHAHDHAATASALATYNVISLAGRWRVDDADHPWKAHLTNVAGEVNHVRVSVKKIGYYKDWIQLALTFANLGDVPVTVLPYDRSVLRDDRGREYPIIAVKEWQMTDRTLFLGLRLPSQGQYTGTLNFELPAGVRGARTFDLTVGPMLRDGGDVPFGVVLKGIAA